MAEHPSYLELDRHALGAASHAETAPHVARCERCRDYLESLTAPGELPAWLSERLRARRPRLAPRATRRWTLVSVGLAAAAALLLVWLRPAPQTLEYDGVKGAPSVAVHVLRGGQVRLWDGAPLEPGDRIRLEVAPEQFRRVSVFSLAPGRPPLGLYAGAVAAGTRQLLPKAWELDAAPQPEQLAVFFSDMEISAQAAEVLLDARDPRAVWLVRLQLPKRTSQGVTP